MIELVQIENGCHYHQSVKSEVALTTRVPAVPPAPSVRASVRSARSLPRHFSLFAHPCLADFRERALQSSSRAVSEQFNLRGNSIPEQSNFKQPFRSRFRAVSEQFRSSFGAVSEQFRSSFGAVSEQFGSSLGAVSEQFQSSFRAVSEQFQSSFRAVSDQFSINF